MFPLKNIPKTPSLSMVLTLLFMAGLATLDPSRAAYADDCVNKEKTEGARTCGKFITASILAPDPARTDYANDCVKKKKLERIEACNKAISSGRWKGKGLRTTTTIATITA